jgi:hypothetical protein
LLAASWHTLVALADLARTLSRYLHDDAIAWGHARPIVAAVAKDLMTAPSFPSAQWLAAAKPPQLMAESAFVRQPGRSCDGVQPPSEWINLGRRTLVSAADALGGALFRATCLRGPNGLNAADRAACRRAEHHADLISDCWWQQISDIPGLLRP